MKIHNWISIHIFVYELLPFLSGTEKAYSENRFFIKFPRVLGIGPVISVCIPITCYLWSHGLLVWRCSQFLSGSLSRDYWPRASCQSHVSVIMRCYMGEKVGIYQNGITESMIWENNILENIYKNSLDGKEAKLRV